MKRIIFVLILLGVGFACFAQNTLTLDAVRTMALANSRTLSKLNLSIQSALLDEKSQNYNNFPSLSLGASASASVWGDTNIQDSFNAGANIGISQTIWSGGKNTVLGQINKISTEITRKEALSEYFSVLDSVDAAYYGVLAAQAALESANITLENSALALSIAEVRRQGGMINAADYLQAQADYESKKTSQNQAKRDLALTVTKLKSVTGLPAIPNLQAVDFTYYSPLIQQLSVISDDTVDTLYSELWNILFTNNPSLSKAALTTQKADHNVTLATKDYFPNLSASLSTGLNYTYQNGFDTSDGKLTISGSIPLDFWVTGTNVKNKKIAQQQSMLDYRETENNLDIEVQTGLLDCIAAAASVISSQKALDYAEKHYENVLELYRLSQNSVSDLSDASTLVSTNRNQLIKSQYSFLLCISVIRSLGAFESEQQVVDLLSGTSS